MRSLPLRVRRRGGACWPVVSVMGPSSARGPSGPIGDAPDTGLRVVRVKIAGVEESTRPPFRRGGDGAVLAGVASGLARHLGVDAVRVRLVFAALTIFGGSGILLYGAYWAVVP